jgi:hypothetical protein
MCVDVASSSSFRILRRCHEGRAAPATFAHSQKPGASSALEHPDDSVEVWQREAKTGVNVVTIYPILPKKDMLTRNAWNFRALPSVITLGRLRPCGT